MCLLCTAITIAMDDVPNFSYYVNDSILMLPNKQSIRPWSGATSILDVYILSHTDWFIGSYGSSYSLLINNLVVRNSIKRNRSENPLYEVQGGGHEPCRPVTQATACSSNYIHNPNICSSDECKLNGVSIHV